MTKELLRIYSNFPTDQHAQLWIEQILWENGTICPYCKSESSTVIAGGKRYKCNTCKNSFSVTVGTIFHRSKIDLRKWLYLLKVMSTGKPLPPVRELGENLEVTKDTAAAMIQKIKTGYIKSKNAIDKMINKLQDGE